MKFVKARRVRCPLGCLHQLGVSKVIQSLSCYMTFNRSDFKCFKIWTVIRLEFNPWFKRSYIQQVCLTICLSLVDREFNFTHMVHIAHIFVMEHDTNSCYEEELYLLYCYVHDMEVYYVLIIWAVSPTLFFSDLSDVCEPIHHLKMRRLIQL